MVNQPLFIAFEGIDGSGKSTQANKLAAFFTNNNVAHLKTNEPTNQSIGQLIRANFSGKTKLQETTIAALFAADRMEHLLGENGLVSQLDQGKNIVCDRYLLSSYAYNSIHVPMDWVVKLNEEAVKTLLPSITFFIDIAPETAMARIMSRGGVIERYETLDNLKKVHFNYHEAIRLYGDRHNIVTINGEQDEEKVHHDIIGVLKSHIVY